MIVREEINDLDRLYNYIDKDSDMILGYLEIRIIDGVIDIINVYTDPDHRKEGIATSLLSFMFNNEDYNRIMLEVNEKNDEAIRVYSKLGFKEISMRNRYYGEDTAIIMEKVKE